MRHMIVRLPAPSHVAARRHRVSSPTGSYAKNPPPPNGVGSTAPCATPPGPSSAGATCQELIDAQIEFRCDVGNG